jgi:hypothetical protein
MNEGILTTLHIGGELAHTSDHPPVLLAGVKKSGSGAFKAGLLLAKDEDGYFPYDGEDPADIAAVCDEPCAADAASCVYQAHGTTKARLLHQADASAATADDLAALAGLTIFPM